MIADIVVLAVLLVSALIAFLRGFIREMLTILGVVGGLLAAWAGGPHLSPLMRGWLGVDGAPDAGGAEKTADKLFGIVPYELVADGLAYGSIFILVVIVLSIVSHMLAEAFRSAGMGALDRTLGVVFGLARGILLLGILYMPVYLLVPEDTKKDWFADSKSYIYIEATAEWMAAFLPEETVEDLKEQHADGETANKAREMLEHMEVLPKAGEPEREKQEAPENGTEQEQKPDDKGYSDDFRSRMDRLFEQKQEQPGE